jgi:hypothetical protein
MYQVLKNGRSALKAATSHATMPEPMARKAQPSPPTNKVCVHK